MSENNTCDHSCSNALPMGLGLAFFIGMFQYGPIDLTRAVYNSLTGDTPVIKRQIGNYLVCEDTKNIKSKNGNLEQKFSNELNIPIKNGKIDFKDAALDDLFDAAEERSSLYGSFIWNSLNDYRNPSCGYKF